MKMASNIGCKYVHTCINNKMSDNALPSHVIIQQFNGLYTVFL